jgi:lysophospholipase L1-like esterase
MHVMKSLHILCFGDSITAGWSHGGAVIHPYADAMLGSLEKALKTYNITADVQGNPGDQVITPPGGFLTRMDILCKLSTFFHSI